MIGIIPCYFLLIFSILPSFVSAFESLVQAKLEVRKDLPSRPLHFAAPDWNYYHRVSHVERDLQALSINCPFATIQLYTAHSDGSYRIFSSSSSSSDSILYAIIRPLKEPAVTRARRFASGLLHSYMSSPLTTVMLMCGEEGRDLLSAEIALNTARKACKIPATLPPHTQLVLIPIANPNGRRISEMGRRCDYTNGNDVDISRNWPLHWRHQLSSTDTETKTRNNGSDKKVYKDIDLNAAVARELTPNRQPHHNEGTSIVSSGTQPFSEKETRSLGALMDRIRPDAFANIRTGMKAITVPWDCQADRVDETHIHKMRTLGESIAGSFCEQCKVGTLPNVTGNGKCGTAGDYAFGTKGVPFALTWHVYEDNNTAKGDCFKRYNPITQAAYERVCDNWARAVLNYTRLAHGWIMVERQHQKTAMNNKDLNMSISIEEVERALRKEVQRQNAAVMEMDSKKLDGVKVQDSIHDNQAEAVLDETQTEPMNVKSLSFWLSLTGKNQGKVKGANGDLADNQIRRNVGSLEGKDIRSDSDPTIFLAGWFGVWASLVMFSSLFYVARRYVFGKGCRRSPFRHRDLSKRA